MRHLRSSQINIITSLVAILIALTLVEIYFRLSYPFLRAELSWPTRFVSTVGWTFTPGETVKHSNFFDFASSQKSNSLGFLDREPPDILADDELRILVVGDSYVEAAQLEVPQKLHVKLESLLQRHFQSKRVRAMALGYSGTGTSNQIPFYTQIGRNFKPHIVILMFVWNDFANNSPLLETIRHGWHPLHPPRLFFDKTASGFAEIAIDSNWSDFVLPVLTNHPLPTIFEPPFAEKSHFLMWRRRKQEALIKVTAANELYEARLRYLQGVPEYAAKLEGWKFPNDLAMDDMFYLPRYDMPPSFSDAIDVTAYAIGRLREEVERDGAKFFVAADELCSRPGIPNPFGRKTLDRGMFGHLRSIVPKEIPLVEIGAYFRHRGVQNTTFRNDLHWNSNGHQYAAGAIAESIQREVRLDDKS